MNNEEVSSRKQDQNDSEAIGQTKPQTGRPDALMPVSSSSENYNMNHKKRGMAVILAYSEYFRERLPPRESAPQDVGLCEKAFENLRYDVSVHWNLPEKDFFKRLEEVRNENHDDSDSLVIIFMSHGGVFKDTNIEYLETFDNKVDTQELWKSFTPEKCPTLAGKPKMFFIQACRGDEADRGVQLRNRTGVIAQTDLADSSAVKDDDYAIPLYADMLIMWASYPGNYAFRSNRFGIESSVFLHFLAQVLNQYAKNEDLLSMLIRVTREVAIHYEANIPDDNSKHQSKQIPQTVSTLMRRLYFFEKADSDK